MLEEHARRRRKTEGRIWPVAAKYGERLLLARARAIAVVVTEVVVIPDGQLRHAANQRLHALDNSLPAQFIGDHLGCFGVGIHIVAEPEEKVRRLADDS